MSDENGEKTEDATPHRREQAREKGQIAFSQDLGSAAILVIGAAALMIMGGKVVDYFVASLKQRLGESPILSVESGFLPATFDTVISGLANCMLPILGTLFIAGIVVSLFQTGILFTPDRIMPDISRLSLFAGVKRIISIAGMMKLGFGLFKLLIISIVAGVLIYLRRFEILTLAGSSVGPIAAFLSGILLDLALWCGCALLLLAVMDYAFQKWKHEQDLKMTSQEVREEMKEMQGDPQVAARRREVQRQLVMNRMGDAVPNADVIITNPTELAIAIKYDPGKMKAPVVVAKGAGVLAQRIRRIALENDIPIVERKPLARLLYKDVEIDQPVPDSSYAAVAEVLAYVYQLKGKSIPGSQQAA